MQSVHAGDHDGFVSAHSILESYAILTRLPRSPRLTPAQAATLLQENVVKHFTVIGLTPKEYGELVERLGRNATVGGQAYDALHLACGEKSGADQIFTFNTRHFVGIAPHLAERIVAP
jgi:hypothetical protein